MSRTFKIAIAAAFAAMALAPAALAEKPTTKSFEVDYSDLDLSREAGVRTLLKRLDVSSRRVCGTRPTSIRFGQMENYTACRTDAVAGAVRRINQPNVTIAYAKSIGAPAIQLSSR